MRKASSGVMESRGAQGFADGDRATGRPIRTAPRSTRARRRTAAPTG